ncbi:MAG: hypothetical protein WDN26_05635 [Chitinophagaceae bacterium]
MKKRIHRIANFFAFNLLFFALYLNFIHKDKTNAILEQPTASIKATTDQTVLVKNPELYLEQKAALSSHELQVASK